MSSSWYNNCVNINALHGTDCVQIHAMYVLERNSLFKTYLRSLVSNRKVHLSLLRLSTNIWPQAKPLPICFSKVLLPSTYLHISNVFPAVAYQETVHIFFVRHIPRLLISAFIASSYLYCSCSINSEHNQYTVNLSAKLCLRGQPASLFPGLTFRRLMSTIMVLPHR